MRCVDALGRNSLTRHVFGLPLSTLFVQMHPSAGTYSEGSRASNRTSPCLPCPEGRSTIQAGGIDISDCSVLAAGYGGVNGSSPCGGGRGANATFGAAWRAVGSDCLACPSAFNGYSFFHRSTNRQFVPDVVSRVMAETAADCLAEFAQVVDAAWSMGGSAALTSVPGTSTFADCIDSCRSDASCEYITYDYEAGAGAGCFKKTALINATRCEITAACVVLP